MTTLELERKQLNNIADNIISTADPAILEKMKIFFDSIVLQTCPNSISIDEVKADLVQSRIDKENGLGTAHDEVFQKYRK